MVTGRQNVPFGAMPPGDPCRTFFAFLCAAALLSVGACADVWGFHDLGESPASGGSGGEGAIGRGAGVGGAGAGGALIPINDGGASGQFGADGSAEGSGRISGTGAGGVRGGAADSGGQAGNGGVAGIDGSGGAGGAPGAGGQGGSSGVADSGDGVDADGAAGGMGGVAETGVCVPGTNRCIAGDLETCSATGAWLSTGTATRQLLGNPAFEQGETGWVVFVAGGFPIVYAADGNGGDSPEIAAQSPPNVTWVGGYNRGDDSISQSIVVPADAASMTLSFYYAIFTRETGAAENDVMDVELMAGAQTISLAHFSDNDPVDSWTRFSAPLPSGLAGQTVTLRFHGTTNANAITSFYVDTVSVQVVACP